MKRVILVFAAAFLLAEGTAIAGTIQPTITYTSPVNPSEVVGGIYVGEYSGYVTYPNSSPIPATFVCDDFSDEIGGGQYWAATTSGPLLFSGRNYNMIEWLAKQIFTDPNQNDWQFLSPAIWSITSGNDPNFQAWYSNDLTQSQQNEVQTELAQAFQHANTPTSGITIYTPVGRGGNSVCTQAGSCAGQEFLSATPEPGMVVMLGTGLLAIGYLLWRRSGAMTSRA
jgi:hypothetical protein